jgi:hypothetical protein
LKSSRCEIASVMESSCCLYDGIYASIVSSTSNNNSGIALGWSVLGRTCSSYNESALVVEVNGNGSITETSVFVRVNILKIVTFSGELSATVFSSLQESVVIVFDDIPNEMLTLCGHCRSVVFGNGAI